ncbi:TonB-linked SusC/RagA family outer membrane protein [Pontibacter ummariensis]|uniref:TonB-linked outer membrane protein, SusC/RagA family n=2 Tax=Pontibacter ummariensis TaxID=1610492 RepID=A0A239HAF3_9BACT|nr:TonB-linked SusC/RagA family outer membrane protein [Pontibacter ummariensis]SNS78252.1 TonB-linked outer membrane protein, SusC/RagA family [Pontibacter ummariensis]
MNLALLLLLVNQAWAQSRTITGKVTDAASGQPLPGVAVIVKGTTAGTATGVDGSYSLNVPEKGNTLVFRYIGYETKEQAIGSASTVNVALGVNSEQLSEVVVQVPYGSVAKTAFTGSEATISSSAIQKQQVTSVTRVLEGLVPGLQTTNGGGAPGSSASVRIRGIGSINASSDPLYVVDGVPFDGTYSSISTDDIEAVTVLKDAAASALYGARAANGVIMITTKKGGKGKPRVAVNFRKGVSERGIPEYDRVNSQEYYELMWEAMRNSYAASTNPATKLPYTPAEAAAAASKNIAGPNGLVYNPFNVAGDQVIDPATGKLNPSARLLYEDNWSDVLFQDATRNDLNVSISGGAENSDYYISAGYINEDGIAKFSDYDRFNSRVKLNTAVSKAVKAGMNISATLSNSNGNFADGTATANPFYFSRYMGPIYPVWQRDGEGAFVIDPATGERALDWGVPGQMGSRPYAGNSNLLGSLGLDERSTRRSEATANAYLEAKFLKNFTFKTTLGGNYYNGLGTTFQNSLFGDAANVAGRSTKSDTRQISYTFNQVLSWNKQFGSHSISALAGHENYSLESRFMSATRTGFPFPGTSELAPAATAGASTSYTDEHKLEGFFSQVSYSFADKYLLSGSFRRDGSSRFFTDSRWGNFYSIGAGWRISEENFFNAEWVDELKLKGSYGEQGNEDVENYYAWQGLYGLGWNNVNAPGSIVSSLPNTNLQWEKNASFNVGADFSLFNKVQGTIEYFERTSDNLLFEVPLPTSTGIKSIWDNVGTMKNYGWEAQLGYNAISTSDFDWRVDLNLTSYKNKITKLPQEEIVNGTKKLMVGHSVYDFWLREYAGVDPANGDALYYKDVLDADGEPTGERTTTNVYNEGTYYYHGSAIPKLVGGVTNAFRYKGLDLSVLLTFQSGGKFYDANYANLMHRGSYGTHWSKDILNRWQSEENPGDGKTPRLQNGISGQDGASTRWLFDASYLTVKNINIGYTLPKSLTGKLGGATLRVFGAVDNAVILTKNEGMDPQRSFNGTSDYTYPIYRTATVGLNANF